jgi:hypothetical protein
LRRFSDIDRRVRRAIAAAALLYAVTYGPQGACHRSQRRDNFAMRLRGFFRDAESGSSKKIRILIILRAF